MPKRYHVTVIIAHWLIAILVMLALFRGSNVLAEMDNTDPEKINSLRGHMIAGIVIGVLSLYRIIMRFTANRPAHAETGNALLDKLGVIAHSVLNLLVVLMVASGVGLALQSGLPDVVFGGEGSLPASFDEFAPRAAHGLLSKALMGLIVLHIAGAFFHQFVLKDKLLSRMGIGKTN